jgi:hypothetical protein
MSFSLSRLHDHTQSHHTRSESFGRAITPLQRPLPDYTQHSLETDILSPGRIQTAIPASMWPQTHALDRVDSSLVQTQYNSDLTGLLLHDQTYCKSTSIEAPLPPILMSY